MLNAVQIKGRLTADPELRTTQSGISVCSFRIANTRPRYSRDEEPQTDFYTCEAWRGTADLIAKHLHKGSLATFEAQLRTDSYVKNGENRTVVKLLINTVHFEETKKNDEAAGSQANEADEQMEKEFEASMADDVTAVE